MKRNFNKQEQRGIATIEDNERSDLHLSEIRSLMQEALMNEKGITSGVYDVICKAYYAGVATGHNIGKSREV